MKSYKPIIKLDEAEIRALEHLSDSIINKIDLIIPHIALLFPEYSYEQIYDTIYAMSS